MRRKAAPKLSGDDVAKAALALVGTPYALRGRIPGVGLDCLGLVVLAHREAGLTLHETPGYRREPRMDAASLRAFLRHFRRLRREDARPGDVLRWNLGPQAHLGVLATDDHGESVAVQADDGALDRVAAFPVAPGARVYRHRDLT